MGQVVAALRRTKQFDNTLLIVTSDNGAHWLPSDIKKYGHRANGQLRGQKADIHEGGHRVPFIARWPGKIKPGTSSNHVGYNGDLFATAAELASAGRPTNLDSVSFLPTLVGEGEQKQHDALYWEFYGGGSAQAVRAGKWKAVRKPMFTGKIELYDLEADIGEQNNLAQDRPKVVERMVALMAKHHTPSPRWKVRKPRKRR